MEIAADEVFSIGSFALTANNLLVLGSLHSAGRLTVSGAAGIQLYGGTLSAQALLLEGGTAPATLFGVGEIDVAGPLYNGGTLIGGNATGLSSQATLTVKAAYIANSGLLEAAVGARLRIETATGAGFSNDVYGTLTGGSYRAQSNATLELQTGHAITSDAATLILDGAGTDTIASFDSASGVYVPIEQSLGLVTPAGTLELDAATYHTPRTLSVAGHLVLIGAADFSAANLYVTQGGQVMLTGALPATTLSLAAGQIIDDGQIEVGADGGGVGRIAGSVSGAGRILLGPQVVTIDRYGQTQTTTAQAELAGATSVGLSYSDGTGTFILDQPAAVSGRFQNFTAGDAILLPFIGAGALSGIRYEGGPDGGVLTIADGGTAIHLAFAGSYATGDFAVGADQVTGGVRITGTALIGLAPSAAHAA